MNIQGSRHLAAWQAAATASTAAATTASTAGTAKAQQAPHAPWSSSGRLDAGTQVSFSSQAQALAASGSPDIQARLDAIKAKPATQRSEDDGEFLRTHDERTVQLLAKGSQAWTADDLDYSQKMGGFVNTMATLSPAEKQLYDELVAQGNTEAVRGMSLLALSRTGNGQATLKNGQTVDLTATPITPENIRKVFSQAFGNADAQDAKSFEALASYLDGKAAVGKA